VEKVVVEKIVNVEKPIAVHREAKQQTSDDLLVFSVFFSFFGIELSVLAVTGVILVMI